MDRNRLALGIIVGSLYAAQLIITYSLLRIYFSDSGRVCLIEPNDIILGAEVIISVFVLVIVTLFIFFTRYELHIKVKV